jgi:hypothetical protein
MRLVLIILAVILVVLMGFQMTHPNCSMSTMVGVDWLECLLKGEISAWARSVGF